MGVPWVPETEVPEQGHRFCMNRNESHILLRNDLVIGKSMMQERVDMAG